VVGFWDNGTLLIAVKTAAINKRAGGMGQ